MHHTCYVQQGLLVPLHCYWNLYHRCSLLFAEIFYFLPLGWPTSACTMRHKPILPWVMRFFSVLQLLTGVGFIIYALILESPPKTAIPM